MKLNFDYIKMTPIEPMHSCFLGIAKSVLVNHYKQTNQKDLLDHRIRFISRQQASNVKRKLRSFDEQLPRFKSSEFEELFFYYGHILFHDIMSKDVYESFFFLSSAVFKLYSRYSSDDDVEKAGSEIDAFIRLLNREEDLEIKTTYNLHCAVHLYEDRLIHGPLINISAAGYENELQNLKRIFKAKDPKVASLGERYGFKKSLLKKYSKTRILGKPKSYPADIQASVFSTLGITEQHAKSQGLQLHLKFDVNNWKLCVSWDKHRGDRDAYVKCIRNNEEEYAELGLDNADDATLLQALAKHPKLLQRAIVVYHNRAVIGRPPERVHDLLKE